MQKGKFNILVDAAWGSSGKGAAAARLADIHRPQDLSASNFPNAGHTVVIDDVIGGPRKFVFKVLPSGSAVTCKNPSYEPNLWIGPNSGFWLADLTQEMRLTKANEGRAFVHPRAVVMGNRHREMEAPGGRGSTEHISSTMSGSGAAFSEKAMRQPQVTLSQKLENHSGSFRNAQFLEMMQVRFGMGMTFFHEVSQGYALSINHGTHYPHCTFRDCTPQQAMADFLVRPQQVGDVYLNVRATPIRVGSNFRDGVQVGYSGDVCPDQREISWQEVGHMAEMPLDEIAQLAERERTTVTKKIRRVFTQSYRLCREAARNCGATKVIYNFPQYVHWSAHQLRGGKEMLPKLHSRVRAELDRIEEATGLPIVLIGTGAHHEDFIFLE